MRALAGLLAGTVRVGAFLTACTSFVPPALARFESAHPDVKIELEQMERAEALRRLRAGELDIAVIWDEFEEPDVEEPAHVRRLSRASLLGQDPYRVVLPRRPPARPPQGGQPGRPRPRALQRPGRRNLPALPRDARPALRGRGLRAGRRLHRARRHRRPRVRRAGVCVGVLPELAIEEPRPDVVVRPLRGLNPARPLHAVWLRGRRVPTIPAMERALAGAAAARLGAPA